jgi:TatD DNase family protein
MKLIDTHCHLDFPDYKDDLGEIIKRAEDAGVVRMIAPGTDIASSEQVVALAAKYPAVFAAVGAHPHAADNVDGSGVSRLREIAIRSDKVVAVGEIGLDYCKRYSTPENQKRVFRDCLGIAKDLDLPVILHNRDAEEDLLRVLGEVMSPPVMGVVHCYSGERDLLRLLLDLGVYISFTGNITFKKAENLRGIIKYVPLERLLLETDSPYIAPVPFRGKRNEPAHVRHLLDVYASVYEMMPEDIARITTHNANQLFHLGVKEDPEVAYSIRHSVYLNITNRCTNGCTFCTRQYSNYVKGHNLKLDVEPTLEEIIDAMGNISGYDEVVFCGYGEPTLRLDIVKKIASFVKQKNKRVRLITNGHGDLINARHIAPELKGLIDRVSVSLNAPNAAKYNRLCRPVFGESTYGAILDFIAGCRAQKIEAEVTCLDMMGQEDLKECRRIAEELDASFRLRKLDVVG